MHYESSRGAVSGGHEKRRRQTSLLTAVWLGSRLPASALTRIGEITGYRARARMIRDLVDFVSHPEKNYNRLAFQWALSYANPGIIRRLIHSVSNLDGDDWWHKILKRADPDLLLPRDHITPDYQMMSSSSASPAKTLVCFTGNALRLNIPVQLFHCAAAHKFDQIVYLRDPKKQYFLSGLEGMGTTLDELIACLQQRILDNCEVSVVGTSGGGIAAARFADTVGAKRLALFSPVFKSNGTSAVDTRGLGNVGAMKIFLARHNDMDRDLCSQWRPVSPKGTINMLDSDSHGTLSHFATSGQLDSVLDWLANRSDSSPNGGYPIRAGIDAKGSDGLPDPQQPVTL